MTWQRLTNIYTQLMDSATKLICAGLRFGAGYLSKYPLEKHTNAPCFCIENHCNQPTLEKHQPELQNQ